MLTKIKILIAKLIMNDYEYCEYGILYTINSHINGISYKEVYNAIGKYFSLEMFDEVWLLLKSNGYIIPLDNHKYIVGAKILLYDYDFLL